MAASWTASEFRDLLRRYPQISVNALAMVGERAEAMLQRVREVTTDMAERRVAKALLRLATKGGVSSSDAALKISGQELAELSDTSPFTVSRIVSAWKKEQTIEGGRGRIVIRDIVRLKAIAGD